MKDLIVVESPAKAKTIKSFLGSNYEVIASKGHIRDLPKKSFGIKIEDNRFIPDYKIEDENKKTVEEIKKLAKSANMVYIATDEDREGEAIGFHIAEAIGEVPTKLPRIVFHEITKKAILNSLKEPRIIDMDRVNAQQARRLLDRIVGYKLSPLISSKIQSGLSAGRVQSAALKIIVDREKELREFKSIQYFSIDALFDGVEADLIEFNSKKIEKLSILNIDEANFIFNQVLKEDFIVETIEHKKRKSQTPPPFMTSTLQQTSSTQLGFSPKKTMSIAQSLYEGVKTDSGISGIITYMRTDSLNISKDAVESVREKILKDFGEKYLPKEPKDYVSSNKSAQEAHEAIRPTNLDFTPEIAKEYLKADDLKLYTLIYNRFVASQMEDAMFESQNIVYKSNSSKFKAVGRKLIFDGFYKLLSDEDKDKLLPNLEIGTKIENKKIDLKEHFTEPPARYSESSLIKKLESLGIGRPSTYAPTISILESREYIKVEKKQIVPAEVAFSVVDLLEQNFFEIVDSSFTASLEENLDKVANRELDWQKLLFDFYEPFIKKLEIGKKEIKSQKVVIPLDENCPLCGETLVKRVGRFGEFVACSKYPKCKFTRNIKENIKKDDVKTDILCDKCGKEMVIKDGKRGKFLACSGYPECKNTRPLEEPKKLDIKCPLCEIGNLVEKSSKRGKFFGCSTYPDCTFITKQLPYEDKKCSECGFAMAKIEKKDKQWFECLKCKHKEPIL